MIANSKLRLLRTNRVFRWLFLGVLGSRIGDTFSTVALSWLALETAGPGGVAAVLLATGLAGAVAGPAAGALIDRVGARVCVIVENVVHAVVLFAMAWLTWIGGLGIAGLVALSFVASLFSMATEVSQDVLLPRTLTDDQLDDGNALLSAIWDSAFFVGPAVAGVVVASYGAEWALVVDAATFVLMAVAGSALPGRVEKQRATADGAPPDRGIAAGFVTLARYPDVARLTIVGIVVLLTTGVMGVVLPSYAADRLPGGAATYGVLLSLGGLASLGGTLTVTTLMSRLPARWLLPAMMGVRGLALVPIALSGNVALAATAVVLTNVAEGPYYPLARSVYQRNIPDDVRGRAAGARSVLGLGGYPLGAALGGALVVWLGTSGTVLAVVALHVPLCWLLTRLGCDNRPVVDPRAGGVEAADAHSPAEAMDR